MANYPTHINCLLFFLAVLIFFSCEKESQTGTLLQGSVRNMQDDEAIYSAYLILGNELLAITDEQGSYEIDSLDPGIYSLVCSAINYRDTIMQLELKEGNVVSADFALTPDLTEGRVYGELHDQTLYDAELLVNPSMAEWSEKELFDGVSGATIQTMTFGFDLPASEIWIGDSLFTLTDGFGQYWFDMQAGTYPLRVSSVDYKDSMQIIKVDADSRIYANFILSK